MLCFDGCIEFSQVHGQSFLFFSVFFFKLTRKTTSFVLLLLINIFYFYFFSSAAFSERLTVDECLGHKWIKVGATENGSDTCQTSPEKNISSIGSIEHENCDRANNESGRSSTPTLTRHVVVNLSSPPPTMGNGKICSSNGTNAEKLNDKENLHCTPLRSNGHSNILSPSVEASVFPDAPTTPKVIRKASPLYSNLRKTAAVSVTTNSDDSTGGYGTPPIVTIVVQQPLSAESLFDDQQQQLVLNNRNTNGCQQRICSPD